MQMQFLGHILDPRSTTVAPYQERKAFGVKGVSGQPGQPLPFHLATATAGDSPHGQLQVDVMLATVNAAAKELVLKRSLNGVNTP